MTVASIYQRTVDTVHPRENALVAAQRMASRCVGTLIVVDDDERAIGILTDRDITLRIVAAHSDPVTTPVVDIMSGELATAAVRESVDVALQRMREHNVRRLPVVDDDGRLCGIVSLEDVLTLLAREMAEVGAFLQQTSPARLATI